ncbi:Major Facilitator Superfamily protein [Nonomuraea solani]|uniref:Major Facilitator Superfamily protein n=1 Tax=Nonomuraea solani TaxID=1144553 RepID=A0A1H6BS03_9ACTN|nr:MFS transporter [Nonomuraea solani]SEG62986.1 Major Facilitator Superfamily protein [Nonomuraea solani]
MATRTTVAAVLVAAFAASTAQTIVIAALPAFTREFGVSATAAPWALTAYMLAGAIATPIAGRLGDLFGYRRIALACLGFFVTGLLLCALSDSFPLLLAGRALAGVSGGLFPLAFGLVRRAVSPARLAGVIALLSAMFGIGGAAGMLAAAPLMNAFGTGWLFWPLLALGIVALVLVTLLPADEPTGGGRVDLLGAVLLGCALAGLLLGISQARSWGAGPAIGVFVVTAGLFAGFAVVELRVRQPLVDLRLLGRRTMMVTNLTTVAIGAAMFGVVTLIPHLVAEDRIAVALLPMVATMLVATPLSPRLGGRLSVRTGAALGIVSCVALVFAHDELWQICVIGLFLGAGYGLAFAAFGTLVVDSVDVHQTGMATGVNTIIRTAGGAIGAQLAAVLMAGGSYDSAFTTFALIAMLALALTAALPQRAPQPSAA